MQLNGNWSYPTTIRFGAGRIAEIGEACQTAGISRPLLVTDRGLAELDITLAIAGVSSYRELDGSALSRE